MFFVLLLAVIIENLFSPDMGIARGVNIKNLAIYSVLIYVLATEFATKNIVNKKVPGLKMLLLLSIYLCISISLNMMLNRSEITLFDQIKLLKNRFFEPVILYVLSILLIDDREKAKTFLKVTVIVFAVVNILSLLELNTDIPIFLTQERLAQRINVNIYAGRFVGAVGNPNQMAYLLCSLLPFMYFFYKEDLNKLVKIIFMVSILLSCVSILMSGSRGGLLTFSIVILSVALIFKDYKTSAFLIAFIFIFILASLLFNNELLQSAIDRLTQSYGAGADVTSGRVGLWIYLIGVFASSFANIFFGTGFETARYLILEKMKVALPSHNLQLSVLVELGLTGFLIWLLMLKQICKFIQSCDEELFKKLTIIFFVVLLVGSMFSELIMITKYIAMVAGISLSYLYHSVKLNNQRTGSLNSILVASQKSANTTYKRG